MPKARMLSWIDHHARNITPFTWITEGSDVNDAAATLAAKPPEDRIVFIWNPFPGIWQPSWPELFAKGFNTAASKKWYTELYRVLQGAGIKPKEIVFDFEGGASVWAMFTGPCDEPGNTPRADLIRKIFDSSIMIPPSVRAFDPKSFGCHTYGRDAYIAWNKWAAEFVATAIKEIVVDTMPALWRWQIPVSNFNLVWADNITDVNGWPLPATAIQDWSIRTSAPACYLSGGIKFTWYKKDYRWNNMLENLNHVRASINTRVRVRPWVSSPHYINDWTPYAANPWLWGEMIKHMMATGVDTFLLWNPTSPDNDKYASDILESLAGHQVHKPSYPLIPLDSEIVVTGTVRTTYSDYLKILHPASPASSGPAGSHSGSGSRSGS